MASVTDTFPFKCGRCRWKSQHVKFDRVNDHCYMFIDAPKGNCQKFTSVFVNTPLPYPTDNPFTNRIQIKSYVHD